MPNAPIAGRKLRYNVHGDSERHNSGKKRMTPITENRMVLRATPRIFEALRLSRNDCRFTHELTVGHSIADLVILRANVTKFWPEAPLSVAESAILSSLRRLGTANVDMIAKEVFMQTEPVRRLLLGRLSNWLLVRSEDTGEFRTIKTWVSQSEIIAVEAKLTRWREALAQATVYRRYADRAFVLLPIASAAIASQHKDDFVAAGVGLLSYDGTKVSRVFSTPKVTEHTWHREFAISRIR